MTPEERADLAKEARVFFMIAPLVGPFLEKRKIQCISRMRLAHQAGEKDHTALVAELAVITDLEDEIKRKAESYNILGGP